jgi:hypothetical protein
MTTKERAAAFVVTATRLAWLAYVAVVAVCGAVYGFTKDGVGGCLLGLAIGVFVGAASATIWALILYFVFKIGRFIRLTRKHSAEGH